MRVNIYIASSVKGLRRQDGVVAFVLELDERKEHTVTQFGTVESVTENESHLRALKYALRRLTKRCNLSVYTDNAYIASAFDLGWLSQWAANDWKNAKNKEIANRSDWEEIAKILSGTAPEFHVKESHSYKNWLEAEIEKRRAKRDV